MDNFKDKAGIIESIKKDEPIKLNLGGGQKRKEGYFNIDILDLDEVDVVADLEKGLEFLPDCCVGEVLSTSFFEHIDNFDHLMEEIHRVLKPGGSLRVYVPHFSNPYFYSDYTHKRFFGYYTFYYFAKNQNKIRRKVPSFYEHCSFEIESINLQFVSVFPVFGKLKKLFGLIVNRSILLQEFYESHLSNVISCYGMEVKLRK